MLARQPGRKLVAVGAAGAQCVDVVFAPEVLADGHEFHFRRAEPLSGVVQLGYVLAGSGAARRALELETHGFGRGAFKPRAAVLAGGAVTFLGIAAFGNPRLEKREG